MQIPSGFAVNEEIELGVIIGKSGKHIKENEAMDYVGGYCIALDMTATCKMVYSESLRRKPLLFKKQYKIFILLGIM